MWDGPPQLSTSTLPSSTLLQILITRAAKADHGSTGRQEFICSYSAILPIVGWSPVGAGDT